MNIMSLGEIVASEGTIINIIEIKTQCYQFALTSFKDTSFATPEEIMDLAKKIYNWVIDTELNKNL